MKTESGPSRYGWHTGDEEVLRCLKEYQLHQKYKVERVEEQKAALNVGTLFHAGRARWFTQGFTDDPETWDSIIEAVRAESENLPHPVPPKDEGFALAIIRQYMDWWKTRPKPIPLATEKTLGPVELSDDGELHTVRLDDISDYGGYVALGEGKTTSGPISGVIAHYERNGGQLLKQMAVYVACGEPYGSVSGVMLDVARKGYGGKPCDFERHFVSITQQQIDSMVESLRWARAMRKRIDAGEPAPRSWQCNRVAGGVVVACPYVDLCKFGYAAAASYTVNGQPMSEWQGEPGEEPW